MVTVVVKREEEPGEEVLEDRKAFRYQ